MSDYGPRLIRLRRDVEDSLKARLNLPGVFTSGDPDPGLPAGLLTVGESLRAASSMITTLDAQFFMTASFLSLDMANDWLIKTSFEAQELVPRLKWIVDQRQILKDVSASSVTVGRPRAPLNAPASQRSHLWVVDIMMNLQFELLIPRDALGNIL